MTSTRQNLGLFALILTVNISYFFPLTLQARARIVPGYSCASKLMLNDFDEKAMNVPVISFLIRDISKRTGSAGKLSILYGVQAGHLEESAFRPLVLKDGSFKSKEDLRPRWVTRKSYGIAIEIDDPNFQSGNPQCNNCKATIRLAGGGEGTGVYDDFNKEIVSGWVQSRVQDITVLKQMEKYFISGWYGTDYIKADPIELICEAPIKY